MESALDLEFLGLGTRKPVEPHQLDDLLLQLTVLSRSAIVV